MCEGCGCDVPKTPTESFLLRAGTWVHGTTAKDSRGWQGTAVRVGSSYPAELAYPTEARVALSVGW